MSDFWARRKAGVAAEARSEALATREADRAAQAAAVAERSDEELLAEFDLPDPDTLDSADDLRRFLGRAVPERLRSRALRRMWRLNPVLANLDGLVDYGEDFNAPEMTRPILKTAYEIGRGFPAPETSVAAAPPANDVPTAPGADGAPAASAATDTPAASAATDRPAAPAAASEQVAQAAEGPEAAPDQDGTARPPRRMRIRYDTAETTDTTTGSHA
ncbi:DUF3306 domain-containing protein [Marinibacterium profundimaris]|uniref:DUF3306 domain-containing protein n=1 Tax=Marinibacterium profundimaris TaxID=1679460 RepID=UPI000B52461D|nr:DUF3306 domain-containing protein [Marinibacterium profundimaris]